MAQSALVEMEKEGGTGGFYRLIVMIEEISGCSHFRGLRTKGGLNPLAKSEIADITLKTHHDTKILSYRS